MSTLLTTKDVATLIATRTLPAAWKTWPDASAPTSCAGPNSKNPPAWPAIPNRA